jgi:hypothetical protein
MNHMNEPDTVKSVTVGRLRWAAHVIRMLDHNPIKNSPSWNLIIVEGLGDQNWDGWNRGWRGRTLDRREWENKCLQSGQVPNWAVEPLVLVAVNHCLKLESMNASPILNQKTDSRITCQNVLQVFVPHQYCKSGILIRFNHICIYGIRFHLPKTFPRKECEEEKVRANDFGIYWLLDPSCMFCN